MEKMKERIQGLLNGGNFTGAGSLLSREGGILPPNVFNDFNRRIKNNSICSGARGGNATGSRTIPSKRAQQGRR